MVINYDLIADYLTHDGTKYDCMISIYIR